MAKQVVPLGRTASKQAKELGHDAYREYINLREGYKVEGLTPKEAYSRAYIELKIGERAKDLHERRSLGEVMGIQVPLTPAEASEVLPKYKKPGITSVKAKNIGDQEMSLAEQVKWAMQWAAKVQNGAKSPRSFPCEGALFWFQSAITNRRDFERLLLKVDGPGDSDNPYIQDSQYQYEEIEKQVKEALTEAGAKLVELEKDTVKLLEVMG